MSPGPWGPADRCAPRVLGGRPHSGHDRKTSWIPQGHAWDTCNTPCDGTDVNAIAVRADIEHLALGAVLTSTVPSWTKDIDDLTLWTRP